GDVLRNFIAVRSSNCAGGDEARTEERDAGHQRENKNKEQRREFHRVPPRVVRDTRGAAGEQSARGVFLSHPDIFRTAKIQLLASKKLVGSTACPPWLRTVSNP